MNSGHGAGGMGGYSGTTQQIEGQNDERLSGLLGKVKSLKDVRRASFAHEYQPFPSLPLWPDEMRDLG